jgi:amino acid permease
MPQRNVFISGPARAPSPAPPGRSSGGGAAAVAAAVAPLRLSWYARHAHDVAAFCNLCAGAIGIGVLSFPYAFRLVGVAGGMAMALLFACVNVLTLQALLHAAEHAATVAAAAGRDAAAPRSYEEVLLRLVGRRAQLWAIGAVLVNQVGQMVACLIVISDLGSPALASCFDASRGGVVGALADPDGLGTRALAAGAFVALSAPFVGAPRMGGGRLGAASALAVAAVGGVVGAILYRFAVDGPRHSSGSGGGGSGGGSGASGGRGGSGGGGGGGSGVDDLRFTLGGVFLAVPVAIFAFGCQLQLLPVWTEHRLRAHALRRRELAADRAAMPWQHGHAEYVVATDTSLRRVVVVVAAFCAVLYTAAGVAGSELFGAATEGNVLKNFPGAGRAAAALGTDDDDDGGDGSSGGGAMLGDALRVTMALHLALAFPVFLFPARSAVAALRRLRADRRRRRLASGPGGSGTGMRLWGSVGTEEEEEEDDDEEDEDEGSEEEEQESGDSGDDEEGAGGGFGYGQAREGQAGGGRSSRSTRGSGRRRSRRAERLGGTAEMDRLMDSTAEMDRTAAARLAVAAGAFGRGGGAGGAAAGGAGGGGGGGSSGSGGVGFPAVDVSHGGEGGVSSGHDAASLEAAAIAAGAGVPRGDGAVVASLVALSAGLALLLPQVSVVFDLLGSTVSVLINLLGPLLALSAVWWGDVHGSRGGGGGGGGEDEDGNGGAGGAGGGGVGGFMLEGQWRASSSIAPLAGRHELAAALLAPQLPQGSGEVGELSEFGGGGGGGGGDGGGGGGGGGERDGHGSGKGEAKGRGRGGGAGGAGWCHPRRGLLPAIAVLSILCGIVGTACSVYNYFIK